MPEDQLRLETAVREAEEAPGRESHVYVVVRVRPDRQLVEGSSMRDSDLSGGCPASLPPLHLHPYL